MVAWAAVALLVVVAGICLMGGIFYHTTFFWAGMIAALTQGVVVGLAGWGLMLGRQAEAMGDLPAMEQREGGMGMTFGDAVIEQKKTRGVRTLEMGFQRVLVALTGVVLVAMAGLIFFLVEEVFGWARANPDKAFPFAGTFDAPKTLDNLGLVMGLAAAAIYLGVYAFTRPGKRPTAEGEAVESSFGMGALGFLAMGIATLLVYLKQPYASEVAGGLIGGLLALQGVELIVNSTRSYSGVEELDQEAVDLQALPLVPMLSSYWIEGVKALLAQSVGMGGGEGERGVIARLMPRALVALVVLAIGASCFRVVPAGQIGIIEHLGMPVGGVDAKGLATPVQFPPGLHLAWPWPVDRLVLIPTQELQYTAVGKELHRTNAGGELDFQFWTIGEEVPKINAEKEDEFATGDVATNAKGQVQASPQLLETYVGVWWRVSDPVAFYNHLSHADFYERSTGGTKALPIYAALVQQATGYAVTKTFATHSLDDILVLDRQHVSDECRKTLQDQLNLLPSGIEIVDLTIKDLHPPFGRGLEPDPSLPGGVRRGPAHAFEYVVDMLEYKQTQINSAERERQGAITRAEGRATALVDDAQADKAQRIGKAQGEAARMTTMMAEIEKSPDAADLTRLAKMNTLYAAMRDAMAAPAKIIKDTRLGVLLWQKGEDGPGVAPRAGSGAGPGQ